MTKSSRSWPAKDRREALLRDLRILLGRGRTVEAAAEQLGIDRATAYRWLGRSER